MAGLTCGVIGLPNVGKSTLFNALTRADAKTENYPFCTIDPNVGVIQVPEPRLERLNQVEQRSRAVPPIIEFVDIAGLVEGASKGEGRGNEFLEHVHNADLLVHVVRAFDDANVAHVRTGLVPVDDIRIVNLELMLADMQHAEKALERYARRARSNEKEAKQAVLLLERILSHLDAEKPVRSLELGTQEHGLIPDCRFLTEKPVMYVPNVGDDQLPDMGGEYVEAVRRWADDEHNSVLPICARLEAEIAELEPDEAEEFVREMGLREDGLSRLIRECYEQLGLITFFTVGDEEVRGWTLREGATAPEAGATIHTDFRDSFIRVEVIPFDVFDTLGSRQMAKTQGEMKTEGKDYVVQDGDILFFRIQK